MKVRYRLFITPYVHVVVVLCRFPPVITGGPFEITIDETQGLLEEILRISATDNDTVTPHNEFVFELTADNPWFGIDEDGKLFVKQVCSSSVFMLPKSYSKVRAGFWCNSNLINGSMPLS